MIEKVINDKLEEYNKSIALMSEKFDETMNRMLEISKENMDLKKDLRIIKTENEIFKKEIADLKAIVHDHENKQLEKQIEIVGIPEENGECLEDLLDKICRNTKMEKKDIGHTNIYRARYGKKNQRNIIIEMNNRDKRDNFLKVGKTAKKNLTLDQIQKSNQKTPYYINEMISKSKKDLLRDVKAVKDSFGIKYIWISRGEIMVRKSEESKALTIKTIKDIDKIFEKKTASD